MQTLKIFGGIGVDVTFEQIQSTLALFDRTERLTVEINSDGGEVQTGVAIYNLLRSWPGGVDTVVSGWALSIASLIFIAGDNRRAPETALVMIHAPWLSTTGNAGALRDTAAVLDQVSETMAAGYRRSNQPNATVKNWLAGADHWFTAQQAHKLGIVTEVLEDDATSPVPANAMAACRHPIPDHLKDRFKMPIPQDQNVDAEAIRAAAIQAESNRRNTISAKFANSIARGIQGAAELRESCVSDPSVTPQAAGEKLLALYAKDVTPIAGHHFQHSIYGGDDAGRISDLCAAARDTLLARAGMPVVDPHPGARDLSRYGIVGIAERILSMGGKSVRDMSPASVITAALGTGDFVHLLSNTAGKSLAIGYDESPAGHALFTAEREVGDFKQKTLLSLSEAPDLLEVPELAEYRHGYMSDSASMFQLTTAGRIITVSRQALVNDDLGAFTLMPRAFGGSARRKEADKVFGVLTENANLNDGNPLFDASHGNLGSAAALSVDSLGAARAAMRKQMGAAALGYLDPMPKWLIVPVSLESKAEQLLASMVDPSKSNDTPQLEWIRRLQLVADPRLDANSDTAWYLSAGPKQMEGILRAYLAGEQRPYLEEASEFKYDAMHFKVRLDFACGVVSYQALYKNPGA